MAVIMNLVHWQWQSQKPFNDNDNDTVDVTCILTVELTQLFNFWLFFDSVIKLWSSSNFEVKARRGQKKTTMKPSPGLCPTPMGMKKMRQAQSQADDVLVLFAGGTECTDVSMIGSKAGLLGPTCRSLALFLAEIRAVQPAIVLHECTSRFVREVFSRWLPEYCIWTVQRPEAGVWTGVWRWGVGWGWGWGESL